MSKYIPQFYVDVITYPCQKLNAASGRGSWCQEYASWKVALIFVMIRINIFGLSQPEAESSKITPSQDDLQDFKLYKIMLVTDNESNMQWWKKTNICRWVCARKM